MKKRERISVQTTITQMPNENSEEKKGEKKFRCRAWDKKQKRQKGLGDGGGRGKANFYCLYLIKPPRFVVILLRRYTERERSAEKNGEKKVYDG
jgi:hypothetical protein